MTFLWDKKTKLGDKIIKKYIQICNILSYINSNGQYTVTFIYTVKMMTYQS